MLDQGGEMIIGVPKEVMNNENRVAIMPSGVNELVKDGHDVYIQKGAGAGAMIPDREYVRYGAKILDTAGDIYDNSEMIIKVKEPIEEEYPLLKHKQILFAYLHLAANMKLVDILLEKKISALAYETVEEKDGSLPLLKPMSEAAGRMSVIIGANLLARYSGGMGILLGGIPGVKPGHVTIAGAGTAGRNAARMALGLGASVSVLDIDHKKLEEIDDMFAGRASTVMYDRVSVEEEAIRADLFISAVLIPGKRAPVILSEESVKKMKKGSVIIDIAIDQGGSVETMVRTTTHDDPTFIKHGVLHYAVPNIPGAVPRTSTIGLTGVTLPYIKDIATKGLIKACGDDGRLKKGLNTYDGKLMISLV
jgi:alanine dehydrogenase